MQLSVDALRTLYEKLTRQQTYPGEVCPAEHVLVAYESALLPKAQGELLEEHLARCPSCREDFISLGKAGQWFRQNEIRVLSGLAAKGAWASILPWSRCPSVGLLCRYVNKDIPATTGGRILLAEMQQHLARCPDCIRYAEEFKRAIAGTRLSLADLASQVGGALLERVRDFGDALLAAAQASGSPTIVRGAPGFRAAETPSLLAPVLDADGGLVVDDQGVARQCRFEIMQANIAQDGFLTIDLAAADRQYHRAERQNYRAAVVLHAGEARLALPETPIDEQGRVTFTGVLPQAKPVDPLPLLSMDVTVRRVTA